MVVPEVDPEHRGQHDGDQERRAHRLRQAGMGQHEQLLGIPPVRRRVETVRTLRSLVADDAATTPYFYSTYEEETEIPSDRKPTIRLIVLASAEPQRKILWSG